MIQSVVLLLLLLFITITIIYKLHEACSRLSFFFIFFILFYFAILCSLRSSSDWSTVAISSPCRLSSPVYESYYIYYIPIVIYIPACSLLSCQELSLLNARHPVRITDNHIIIINAIHILYTRRTCYTHTHTHI